MKLPRLSRTLVVALVTTLAITLPGLGITAAYAYAGDVPRGTTVLGIDIGARSTDEAGQALRDGLAPHAEALAQPVPIRVGDLAIEIDPADIELAVDIDATVAEAASGGANPFRTLFGTREVPPVVTVNVELLDELLREVADDVGEAMVMPEITFEGTEPVPVYPQAGLGLDPGQSAQAVIDGWPQLGGEPGQWRQPAVISVPLAAINPVTTAADVDQLIAEFARPAVAAPVTISIPDGTSFEASPAAIAKSLRLRGDANGEIIPKVDHQALRKALGKRLAEVETAPTDAKVVLSGGGPSVVESVDGISVDTQQLADQLLEVLAEPAPRRVEAEVVTAEPGFDTEAATALGIREQVSSFTTYFEGGLALPRNHNIATVAKTVDGAIVQPGEVFSLNGFTGERSYPQGYQDAPVILEGRLQPAVGGGISQFTTTLFNAAYYAGLEDVEHHPHSYHYSRYPAVIEATIFYPSLDLKFRNDTEYGILIDTSYNEESITVTMWSTKVWDDVTTEWSPRRDITKPRKMYVDPGPSCIDTQGIDGFTQDAWRIFYRDGNEVKREQFTWRYDAQPEVKCEKKPDDD